MQEERTWKKEAKEYLTILFIFFLLRVAMIDQGFALFHIPIIDKQISALIGGIKSLLK